MTDLKRVTVIGAGFMGGVIATLYARHGYKVALHDTDATTLNGFRDRLGPIAKSLADESHTAEQIFANIEPASALEAAIDGSILVHETVKETLSIKQELFAALDRMCAPDVVIATNTSSFVLTDVCAAVTRKERVIGIHFVAPAHIIPVVEIIHANVTPAALIEWARAFVRSFGYIGVTCLERPGFLINRIQLAMIAEVYRILDEGAASAEDVDAAVRLSLGPRLALWGPLLTEDLVVNKRTTLAVFDYLHEKTGDARFAAVPILRERVQEGALGALSGRGWHAFKADYPAIVTTRDRQLRELLNWLQARDSAADVINGAQASTRGSVTGG
jgi:3-hydroxybutyryl-CoA dehydrogenase